MKRIDALVRALMLALLPGMISCGVSPEENTLSDHKKPNILLILVDDMGYSDIGCFGGEIPTPNIDRLASEGMRMTHFYNAARCCPSRASLLTGLYPHEAGMGHQNRDLHHPSYRGALSERATTIAEVLQGEGYATYHVGKWHLGNRPGSWPGKKGFDEYFSLIEGAMNYYNRRPWVKNQDSLHLTYNGIPYYPGEDFYATRTFTDSAVSFIRQQDPGQPFFMYLAYNAPHWPLHAPEESIEKFRGKYLCGWDSIRAERHRRMISLGIQDSSLQLSDRFYSVPAWSDLDEESRKVWDLKMALYAAVMDQLDQGIGEVMECLETTKQLQNTLVIFLSDNGGSFEDPVPAGAPWAIHPVNGTPGGACSFPSYGFPWANASNTPFSYFKSFLHEGGIATPLIVRYEPMIPRGAINRETLGHVMDLMPTILDLVGGDYPSEINGREITPSSGISLLPAWKGANQQGHDLLIWEHQFNRAVRYQKWKLVSVYRVPGQPGNQNHWELYDLSTDPTEQFDLVDIYPEKVSQMEGYYQQWAQRVGALSFQQMDSLKKEKPDHIQ